jgi:hypothetical protein
MNDRVGAIHFGAATQLDNDAVEEALCFGWIDSTVKSLNKETTIQRFCRRRKNSSYSEANKEQLKWLCKNVRIHKSIFNDVEKIVEEKLLHAENRGCRLYVYNMGNAGNLSTARSHEKRRAVRCSESLSGMIINHRVR